MLYGCEILYSKTFLLYSRSTSPSFEEDLKETRIRSRSPRILSEILNEVPPPPREEELRGDPRDKLTFSTEATTTSSLVASAAAASGKKIEDVITKSSDSDESKEPLRNRAASEDYDRALRSSPPPLELAKKPKTLPFIVIQTSGDSENDIMWESRGTAQVRYRNLID